jgi:hypothetical protein
MGFLAASMILVMIVWFGFLGWGMAAFIEWLWDSVVAFRLPS